MRGYLLGTVRQTDTQTDRQSDRGTDTKTFRQLDRQANRQTDKSKWSVGHTWWWCTHQAEVTILASQAALRQTQAQPAWEMLRGGMAFSGSWFLTIVEAAPCRSACTYRSPLLPAPSTLGLCVQCLMACRDRNRTGYAIGCSQQEPMQVNSGSPVLVSVNACSCPEMGIWVLCQYHASR